MALAKVEFAVAGARRGTASQHQVPALIQPLPRNCWTNFTGLTEPRQPLPSNYRQAETVV
jgi:hypothetical protein